MRELLEMVVMFPAMLSGLQRLLPMLCVARSTENCLDALTTLFLCFFVDLPSRLDIFLMSGAEGLLAIFLLLLRYLGSGKTGQDE